MNSAVFSSPSLTSRLRRHHLSLFVLPLLLPPGSLIDALRQLGVLSRQHSIDYYVDHPHTYKVYWPHGIGHYLVPIFVTVFSKIFEYFGILCKLRDGGLWDCNDTKKQKHVSSDPCVLVLTMFSYTLCVMPLGMLTNSCLNRLE